MDYEKLYKDALERAKKIDIDEAYASQGTIAKTIFPELAESEDERIRKEMIGMINECTNWAHKKEYVNYLEKQKENSKSADSISSDCVSNAKCEDRWHKTANSLPDNGRDVLAKDALGNYLLASFDGAQWFASVYDGEDHPVLHTPPILEWCEIPSEKQKEQKPNIELIQRSWYMEGYHDREFGKEPKWVIKTGEGGPKHELNPRYGQPLCDEQHPSSRFHPGDWVVYDGPLGHAILQVKDIVGGRYSFVDNVSTLLVDDSDELLRLLTPKDVEKPAEWSEEDKDMLNSCISSIEEAKENRYAYKETDGDTSYDHEIAWLKSLRPRWKPSEEQMKALCSKLPVVKGRGDKVQDILETLYYDLKKRGVKEEPDC